MADVEELRLMATFMLLLTVALSVFLILLILIQRGRGGGLAGAFGGAGGQSAIGTRAGDVFTRITIVVILLWFILNAVTGIMMRSETKVFRAAKPSTKATSDAAKSGTAGDASPDTSEAPAKSGSPESSGTAEKANDAKDATQKNEG